MNVDSKICIEKGALFFIYTATQLLSDSVKLLPLRNLLINVIKQTVYT
jgi:hypothetical protein